MAVMARSLAARSFGSDMIKAPGSTRTQVGTIMAPSSTRTKLIGMLLVRSWRRGVCRGATLDRSPVDRNEGKPVMFHRLVDIIVSPGKTSVVLAAETLNTGMVVCG